MVNLLTNTTYDVYKIYDQLAKNNRNLATGSPALTLTGNGLLFIYTIFAEEEYQSNSCTVNVYFERNSVKDLTQCFSKPISNNYFVSNKGKSLIQTYYYADFTSNDYQIHNLLNNTKSNANNFLNRFSPSMLQKENNQFSFIPIYFDENYIFYLDGLTFKVFDHDFLYIRDQMINEEIFNYLLNSGFNFTGSDPLGIWNNYFIKSGGDLGFFMFDFTNNVYEFVNIPLFAKFLIGDRILLYEYNVKVVEYDLLSKQAEYYNQNLFPIESREHYYLFDNSFVKTDFNVNISLRALRTGYIFYYSDLTKSQVHAFNIHDKTIYQDLNNLPINIQYEKAFVN
jgi:hypothetical protein